MLENAEVILTFATDSLSDYLSENEPTQKILGAQLIEHEDCAAGSCLYS
jgi:hypothetical protein